VQAENPSEIEAISRRMPPAWERVFRPRGKSLPIPPWRPDQHPGRARRPERALADAFAAHALSETRPVDQPDVVCLSPTARLFGWPARVEGVDRTLEFIDLGERR
jgi:hypothetical protein